MASVTGFGSTLSEAMDDAANLYAEQNASGVAKNVIPSGLPQVSVQIDDDGDIVWAVQLELESN